MSVSGWDGVTLTVELGLADLASGYGLWGSGVWGDSTWGPDVAWTDVTSRVRTLRTDGAFSRAIQTWAGGTATLVLDDRDGQLSPANLTGSHVSGGQSQIQPLLPVRIRAAYGGVTYPLWYGYARKISETWSGGAPGRGDAALTINCCDEVGRLAKVDPIAVAALGAGDSSGARVHRVLDAAEHTGGRAVDVGQMTLQATTLDDPPLTELENVVTSEGGALWVDPAGSIVFEGRSALVDNDRSVQSQATFTDDGTAGRYASTEADLSDDLVINYASYARAGGTAQVVSDATSRARGLARDTKTDLLVQTDAQALSLAQWVILQYKDPEYRFTQITILPRRDPATLWPQVLGRRVRDQITVVRNPPGGFSISRACHIAGISHEITPTTWTTTWPLWSAEPYVRFANSRWDVGLWDNAAWGY
jgi:hypothetical protein